jgi:hypothetical protein
MAMKLLTRRAPLRIPKSLVVTTLGCVLACSPSSAQPGPDASLDGTPSDALADGCIYQLCNGLADSGVACPGVVCLVPPEQCPPGCMPVV